LPIATIAVTLVLGAVFGVATFFVWDPATNNARQDGLLNKQFDIGCISDNLGARAVGNVRDCQASGPAQIAGKFAMSAPMRPTTFARPTAPMARPTAPGFMTGSSRVQMQFVPMRAGRGNVLMAVSEGEATRKFFIGGNWKANGDPNMVKTLVSDLNKAKLQVNAEKDVEVVCSPPFVYLSQVKETLRKDYSVAAQNMWDKAPGAWTGEIPAEMLTNMGVGWVILGHSERRENCGETDQIVADKTKFAIEGGLSTITCIGEKKEAREGGTTFNVLDTQMKPLAATLSEADWDKVVLAYEPVWAIGTGLVATPEQAEETHAYLRKWLTDNVSKKVSDSVRILYGGSVNDQNSAELGTKPNIDGFLVGGASLKGDAFTTIVDSAKAAMAA